MTTLIYRPILTPMLLMLAGEAARKLVAALRGEERQSGDDDPDEGPGGVGETCEC